MGAMGASALADNLDPLHRGCLSRSPCGSLILAIAHAPQQTERDLFRQDVAGRTHTSQPQANAPNAITSK
jgi:hypothetical protein